MDDSTRKRPGRTLLGAVREIALILIVALLLSAAVKTWVMRSFYIPSASMADTLQVGDRILVNQLPWSTVERGDIVVFDDPGGWLDPSTVAHYDPNPVLVMLGLVPADAGQQVIKRVIGMGGDTVECCDGTGALEVNGVAIDEPYLAAGVEPSTIEFSVNVPADHLWVMGDNRSNSQDSRFNEGTAGGAFVPVDNVVGTVFLLNWPFDRFRWVSAPDGVFAEVPAP